MRRRGLRRAQVKQLLFAARVELLRKAHEDLKVFAAGPDPRDGARVHGLALGRRPVDPRARQAGQAYTAPQM